MDHKGLFFAALVGCALPLAMLQAQSLTPKSHPQNNKYYICYQNKSQEKLVRYSNYVKYHYHGCLIAKLPCQYKSGLNNQSFGKFSTYPLALNAYYRCAYS